MAQQVIQSVNLPLELSTDNKVTWKRAICVEGYTMTNTAPTTDADTQCGRFTGIGIEGTEISGTAVLGMYPSAAELSYTDVRALQLAQTQSGTPPTIWYRQQYPASGSIGSFLYQTQQCLISVTSITNATGQVIKWGFTLKSLGVASLTPGT